MSAYPAVVATDPIARLVADRTVQISAIPAPPLDESDRAVVVEEWFRAEGCADVHRDTTGNVWGRVGTGTVPALVVCAHLDTVFSREVPHGVRSAGSRMVGPGVGDDSVALAAVSALPRLLDNPPDDGAPAVWLLATVGEEGLGDLAGARAAMAAPPAPIGAVLAVEGNYLGRLGVVGVGSRRYRVEVRGPGGHAWERRDEVSAVHVAARAVAALDAAPRPAGAATAVNVGRMDGGEAINVRAARCAFEVDLRADDPAALTALDATLAEVLAAAGRAHPAATLTTTVIGDRPAGRIAPDHPLVVAAEAGYAAAGIPCTMIASSTDANAAHVAGVPALAVGVAVGAGEHTESEWIDLDTLPSGLAGLAGTVRNYLIGAME